LSGPGAVVGDVVACAVVVAFELALSFAVWFVVVEHPIPKAAINGIVNRQIFFVTLLILLIEQS
jgi:hypothetical protein